jgi:hypothetical protein
MDNPFEYNECPATGAEPLSACFYKAKECFWVDGRWKCPHCAELNRGAEIACRCGFNRESLEQFSDKKAFSTVKLVLVLAL